MPRHVENADGIYPRQCSEITCKTPPDEARAIMEEAQAGWSAAAGKTLEDELLRIRQIAAAVRKMVPPARPDMLDDAAAIFCWIQQLCQAVATSDARLAAQLALELGCMGEELRIKVGFEHKVIRVNATTRKLRDGAREQQHNPAKIDEAIRLFNCLVRAKPAPKKAAAYRKVQEQTGIPPRTLRRHLVKQRIR